MGEVVGVSVCRFVLVRKIGRVVWIGIGIDRIGMGTEASSGRNWL